MSVRMRRQVALHTDEDDGAALFLYRKLSKEPMQPPLFMQCFPVDASDAQMQVSFASTPLSSWLRRLTALSLSGLLLCAHFLRAWRLLLVNAKGGRRGRTQYKANAVLSGSELSVLFRHGWRSS